MIEYKLMNIYELEDLIEDNEGKSSGVLFCFGTSFISRLIMAKTRLSKNEIVPSHVSLIYGNFIYESTTGEERVGHKYIRHGVRRWLLADFIKAEKSKLTKYIYLPAILNILKAEQCVHLPYGKDIILDFLLKDGSDGESNGLICSQYANLCLVNPHNKVCPSPADLLRMFKRKLNISIVG